MRVLPKGGSPGALELFLVDLRLEDVDRARLSGRGVREPDPKTEVRASDGKRRSRAVVFTGLRRDDEWQRVARVAEEPPAVPFDKERRVVEVVADAPERSSGGKAEVGRELAEGLDARKARPPRARLEMLPPEGLRPPRLARGIALGRVLKDLRRALKGHSGNEPRKERLEKAQPRLGARQIEGFEDLVDGKGGVIH